RDGGRGAVLRRALMGACGEKAERDDRQDGTHAFSPSVRVKSPVSCNAPLSALFRATGVAPPSMVNAVKSLDVHILNSIRSRREHERGKPRSSRTDEKRRGADHPRHA